MLVRSLKIMLLAACMLALPFAYGIRKAEASDVVKWRMQTALPPASYAYSQFYKPFCDLVQAKTKGKLVIKCMPPGAMLTSKEIFSGVMKGVVEVGGSVGAYHARIMPEAEVEFGLPCNFTAENEFYDFYYKYQNQKFLKLLKEAYASHGLHFLGEAAFRNAFQTKFEIKSVDDVKGKKIRAVGSMAKLVKALGGSAVSLASVEQYTALQRGTVDGTIMAIYATNTYKLYEVTKYISLPPIGFSGLDIYCNKKAYDKLPADLKKAVDEAAMEAAASYREAYKKLEETDIAEAKAHGVKVVRLDSAAFAKFRKVAEQIWAKVAAKSPRCAQMIDLLKAYNK